MTENTFKKPEKEKKTDKTKGQGVLQGIVDGSVLQANKVISMIPFLFFLTFLAFTVIFNTYLAEKKARKIELIRTEVVELHLKYISVKSELMYLSNQSEVARKLKDEGFVESVVPPVIVRDNK